MNKRQKKFTKNEIQEIINKSHSIADVCRNVGWKPVGDNYKTVHRYISEYELDVSHFTGKRTNIGNVNNKHNEKPVEYYLRENSYINSNTLKNKLFSSGLKKYKCEDCGCNKWNDKQISLQLHHINGNDTDNRLENLQILCPNCHSQTDTFTARNIKNQKEKKYYCKGCKKEIKKTPTGFCDKCYDNFINDNIDADKITRTNKVVYKKTKRCKNCGNLIDKNAELCTKCYKEKIRKVKRPDKENLFELIKTKSFSEIGRMFGVTDNSIRKWCKAYNLPYRKKDIVI